MTKALALARSFHRAGHRVILVESARYRLSGHRFSRAVDRFYTVPTPDAPGYCRGAARNRPRRGGRRLRTRVQPGGQPARCRRQARPLAGLRGGARRRRHGPHARRQGRVLPRSPTPSASRCPITTASPRPGRCSTSTSPPTERPTSSSRSSMTRSAVSTSPGCPAPPRSRRARSWSRCRSRRTTHGSCSPSSPAGSTARTAPPATGRCSCTAAVSPRRSSSTTRWPTCPRSRRGSGASSAP